MKNDWIFSIWTYRTYSVVQQNGLMLDLMINMGQPYFSSSTLLLLQFYPTEEINSKLINLAHLENRDLCEQPNLWTKSVRSGIKWKDSITVKTHSQNPWKHFKLCRRLNLHNSKRFLWSLPVKELVVDILPSLHIHTHCIHNHNQSLQLLL